VKQGNFKRITYI